MALTDSFPGWCSECEERGERLDSFYFEYTFCTNRRRKRKFIRIMSFLRKWKGHSLDSRIEVNFEPSKKIHFENSAKCIFLSFSKTAGIVKENVVSLVVVWNRHSPYQQGNGPSRRSFTFQRRAAASLISKDLPNRWKFPPNWNDRSFLASNHSISYSWQNQQ